MQTQTKTQTSAPEGAKPREIIVKIELIKGNPKPADRVWVAEITPEGLKFLRAFEPDWWRSKIVGGRYKLTIGCYYIVKSDDSSWRHRGSFYTLYKATEEGLQRVASIAFDPGFKCDDPDPVKALLLEAYANPPKDCKSKAIWALRQVALAHEQGQL